MGSEQRKGKRKRARGCELDTKERQQEQSDMIARKGKQARDQRDQRRTGRNEESGRETKGNRKQADIHGGKPNTKIKPKANKNKSEGK